MNNKKMLRTNLILHIFCLFFVTLLLSFTVFYLLYLRIRNLESEVEKLRNDFLDNYYLRIDQQIEKVNGEDKENEYLFDNDTVGFIVPEDLDDIYEEYGDYNKYNNTITDILKTEYNEMEMLKKNNTSQNRFRTKRNVEAATDDDVLISSYTARKSKKTDNETKYYTTDVPTTPMHLERDIYGTEQSTKKSPNKVSSVLNKILKTFLKKDKDHTLRQVVKKLYLELEDHQSADEQSSSKRSSRQISRNLDEPYYRISRIKPLPSIHFYGDTSRYVFGQHSNFNGNGHLKHPQRTFQDWKASDWVEATGMTNHFSMDQGMLTIKETGIYFVYAQIYYLDEHDVNGYRVYQNDEMILQCTVTFHSSSRTPKGNTCYTAGVSQLTDGDRISLGDITGNRYSLFEPGKSFFGLIKLGDFKLK